MQESECWHEWLPGLRAPGAEFLVGTLRWGHPRKSCLAGPPAGPPRPSKYYTVMNYILMGLFLTHMLLLPTRLSAPEWGAHWGKSKIKKEKKTGKKSYFFAMKIKIFASKIYLKKVFEQESKS